MLSIQSTFSDKKLLSSETPVRYMVGQPSRRNRVKMWIRISFGRKQAKRVMLHLNVKYSVRKSTLRRWLNSLGQQVQIHFSKVKFITASSGRPEKQRDSSFKVLSAIKWENTQKARCSQSSHIHKSTDTIKFMPWQQPTAGNTNAMAVSTRSSSLCPSFVLTLSVVLVLGRSQCI